MPLGLLLYRPITYKRNDGCGRKMEECVGAMPPNTPLLTSHVCRIFIMGSYRKYGQSDIVIYFIILQQLIAVTDVIK